MNIMVIWSSPNEQGLTAAAKDDFQKLYDDMAVADGLIFITPVYWHDMSENLKCFLDRLRRCETAHNHKLKGKICILIACAGETFAEYLAGNGGRYEK